MPLRRPGNGDDPWLLREQPRERDLRGGGVLLRGEAGEQVHDCLVRLAIFFREAREVAAEVALLELRVRVELAGEESASERAEGDESDAEFFERRKHFL